MHKRFVGSTLISGLFVMLFVGTAPSTANAVTADSSKKRLTYVVAPHPDDELQGWSLVQNSPDNYNVFILLTRGENTGYCTGGGFEGQYGERHPEPFANTSNGFGAVNSSECKAQRLNSRESWLDRQAQQDANLGTGSGMSRFRLTHTYNGYPAPVNDGVLANYSDWQVGSKSARVVFDLGDNDLTVEEINWAIQTVRGNRSQLPNLPESNIIGASYYNKLASCYPYDHPDHLAAYRALYHYDQGTPGVQWGAACKDDVNVARTGQITDTIYHANMARDEVPLGPMATLVSMSAPTYADAGVAETTPLASRAAVMDAAETARLNFTNTPEHGRRQSRDWVRRKGLDCSTRFNRRPPESSSEAVAGLWTARAEASYGRWWL